MTPVSPTALLPKTTWGWTLWSIVAAFGTYFCMYAFRKPFTAAGYHGQSLWGVDFKTILITAQVMGYMVSKFLGIKVVAEMPPERRAISILLLIALAQAALLLFAIVPAPYSAVCLFLNGLPLGIVFGLVLGCLEGRQQTEFLTAGLCASFILADGVMKSLGAQLVHLGVSIEWMPFTAGLVAAPALVLFTWMLANIPAPNHADVAARAVRSVMNRAERQSLYFKYAAGLTVVVGMYLLVTIVRSIRADFALEIWHGLGVDEPTSDFTTSEIFVALGVLAASGLFVLIRDNRRAFFASLVSCGLGFLLIVAALVGQRMQVLPAFVFMVLVGLGLYLPYVAVHTTVFERLLAMTRERGTIGYLMYVADAFGYLGYVVVMLSKHLVSEPGNLLPFFANACWIAALSSLVGLLYVWWYFHRAVPAPQAVALPEVVA